MSFTLIIVVLVILMAAVGMVVVLLTTGGGPMGKRRHAQSAVSSNLRSLVAAQRYGDQDGNRSRSKKENLALAAAAESDLRRQDSEKNSRLPLARKLRYGHWPISPTQFRAIQTLATLILFIPLYLHGTIFLQGLAALVPFIVTGLLDRSVNKRFQAFDQDYPVLLLSYVSLLKTGMSTIAGLEAAAKGLDEKSLVRSEIELMIERLRLGLTEEQAISSFGEDIAHPELELFVQSLLLSRKVGGTLSSTLERLARQVRKRQQFRQQAVAAVGMERSSIYMIAAIMSLLLGYLTYASPELVLPAFQHDLGNTIFQAGLSLIFFGFFWSRKVTNIKI